MLTSDDKPLKEKLFSKSEDMISGLVRFNEKVRHQAEKPIGCIARLFKRRRADLISDEMTKRIFQFSLGEPTLPPSGEWREKVPEHLKDLAETVYTVIKPNETISEKDMKKLVEEAKGVSCGEFGSMTLNDSLYFVGWVETLTKNVGERPSKPAVVVKPEEEKVKEEERLQELAEKVKKMPYIEGTKLRGVYNPGCLCYRNALIKAFAASPAFEKAVNESDIAKAFLDFCEVLKEEGRSVGKKDGTLLWFNGLLQNHFPGLGNPYRQQDIQELMGPFLEQTVTKSVFEIKEVMEKVPESWRYHMWRVWYGLPKDFPVPAINKEGKKDQVSNIFFKMPSHGRQPFSIEQIFTGRKNVVGVTVDNVLASEGLSETKKIELAPLLQKAADSKRNLYPVTVHEKVQLEGDPPSFLPVYVARFREDREKNRDRVEFPFFLQVPLTKGRSETYVLRGVAVHWGENKNSGHYITYIPDPKKFDLKTRMASDWTEHSDTIVTPRTWNDIKDDIERNGCVFVYDRVTE
jgi:hypothetical protein